MSSSSPVWIITGASSGIGAALALHVLKAGHRVIATARNPPSADSYQSITSLGGKWVSLDVNSRDTSSIIQDAAKIYGRLDVVVNNAGYSILGAVEDISEEEARSQLETNFFGPLRIIRTVLPILRAQNSGTIVNITSVAGFDGLPTSGLYAASKFAVEGLSESLAREVSSFNIRVLLVEPGAFRTKFLASMVKTKSVPGGMSKAYEGTAVEKTLGVFDEMNGKQKGDVEKGVERIFEVVMRSGRAEGLRDMLRLPLGEDCVKRYEAKVDYMRDNLDEYRSVALGLDHADV